MAASCVVAFAVLAGLVASHWPVLLAGDQAADSAAHLDVLTEPWLLRAARVATAIGSPVVVDVVSALVLVALLVTRFWRAAVLVALARDRQRQHSTIIHAQAPHEEPKSGHRIAFPSPTRCRRVTSR